MKPQSEDKWHTPGIEVVAISLLLLLIALGFGWSGSIHAAGYEEVEITHVRNTTQLVCPPQGQSNVHEKQGGGAAIPSTPQGSAGSSAQGNGATQGSQFRTPGRLPGTSAGSSGSSVGSQAESRLQGTRAGCWESLAYLVTYKRRVGGGGEIVRKSYPVAKTMQLYFCPGPQGQPERPC
jgi:hypothetical protein